MPLEDELAAAAASALEHAGDGETLTGLVPAEPGTGIRVYLCSFEHGEERSWLALDARGRPVTDRRLVRDAVSVAALVEIAEETAGGGDLGALRARLVEIRLTDDPEGIEEAELAAAELAELLRAEPRVASAAYLDAIGLASSRLERALGETGASQFAVALKAAMPAAEELADAVEAAYKAPLE
jgi:hypothetical protein